MTRITNDDGPPALSGAGVTPYYADDLVTIYHGDCRDLLTDERFVPSPGPNVAVIVTDPPYGIAYQPGTGGRGFRGVSGSIPKNWGDEGILVTGDDQPFDPAHLLALGLPSVLFGGNHYAHRLPPSPSWLVWDKRDGMGSNDFADCELAWTNLGGPARVLAHRWSGLMRDSERGQKRWHPTMKPVYVMRWIIERCPPGLILDPYAGSGTTLVAAKSLGRRSIGIEIEERYCEIAAQRCAQEVLGLVG